MMDKEIAILICLVVLGVMGFTILCQLHNLAIMVARSHRNMMETALDFVKLFEAYDIKTLVEKAHRNNRA